MRDLAIRVLSAEPVSPAMTPVLRFRLELTTDSDGPVDAVLLSCQVLIEVGRRTYIPREGEALLDIVGEPARWGRTMKATLWTHAAATVPAFTGTTVAALDIPCTYDLCVTAGKYFFALEDGEVPLTLQFSGTMFHRDEEDRLSVSPIPWSCEASFRLPVSLWRRMMTEHYGDGAWLCLRREVVDKLLRYKSRRGLASYDDALAELLDGRLVDAV